MTKQYDAEAMRYLSYALYPLVAGYAIYALLYETHRSWYSWVLHSLVGAVYTFGFILMCPQVRAQHASPHFQVQAAEWVPAPGLTAVGVPPRILTLPNLHWPQNPVSCWS